MPLHRFYIPRNTYSKEDKAALSEAITSVYNVLPKFYVVVLFIEVDKEDYFVGGKSVDNFVRVVVHHYAVTMKDDTERKHNFLDKYEAALKPFTKDRGLDWEVEVLETDLDLWHENGLLPPPFQSEDFNVWKREDRPLPYGRYLEKRET